MELSSPDEQQSAPTSRGRDRGAGGGGGGGGDKGPDVQEVLGTYVGSIKNFNEKSGYGFITCQEIVDQGYKDVFLHHAQIGDFRAGEEVQFTAFLNKKGQVQA